VAIEAGNVIGLAFSGPSHDPSAASTTAEVEAIYLDPGFVRRGIGRLLLGHLVTDLRDRGFHLITLWVLVSNLGARRFYEATSWQADGETKTETRHGGVLDEIRYRYTLDPITTDAS
jgi:ribosomal protein S18 acetylase RimI-like enzyme